MKTRLRLGAILHFIISIGHVACLFFLEEAFNAYGILDKMTRNRYLIYTKDLRKDGVVTMVPIYMVGLL